jgi:predicted amidohydrolase YtcJ
MPFILLHLFPEKISMDIRFFFPVAILLFSCTTIKQADTIVHNGNIYTVNKDFDKVQAFVISDGKIIELGSDNKILKKYSAAETIDAKGQAVYPGFIDAHVHFLQYGQSLYQVDLYGVNSWEEIIQKVKQFASIHPAEVWILGRGWDQNKRPGKAFPTNEKLNELFPDKPVLLERVDGHAAIANQKALDIVGQYP